MLDPARFHPIELLGKSASLPATSSLRTPATTKGLWPILLAALLLFGCTKLDENGFPDGGQPDVVDDMAADGDMYVGDVDIDGMDADAVGDADMDVEPDVDPAELLDIEPPDLSEATFKVQGTVNQIYIWSAPEETPMEVLDGDTVIATGTTDYQGSLVLRELEAARDLEVRVAEDTSNVARGVNVLSEEESQPSQEFYEAHRLKPGFGYITMRDGTRLSVYVSLPGPPEDGPYPTIVNYSGYSPSQPGGPINDSVGPLCESFPVLCDAPNHPAGVLAGVGGYASVGVNMRGTGCSGGAYDYFEPLQLMDGYDIVEIVAAQDWVKHNHVGMAGLSYPGIAQLFVAKTRPPSLAAIAPMSVIADSASSVLAPGGIYNDGFALAWINNVLNRALPYGHGWIQDLVDAGDTTCEEHQLLHSQMVNVVQKALDNPYYTDEVAGPLDPSSWVDTIDVPVFLTGVWQDEQTGPHFAALLDKFDSSPQARFTVTNGVHADGYTPQILMDWKIFLDLYVAEEVPYFPSTARSLVPLFFADLAGAALELPENRFEEYTSYEQALADYESEKPLRVIWESGADPEYDPGAPSGRFETFHDAWPLPETQPRRWYMQPDGMLMPNPPASDGGASVFNHNPEAGTRTTIESGSVNRLQPNWNYRQLEDGHAVAFETPALTEDLVMLGHGSVDLWIQSTATDADLEVHLTEIRPDGQEMLVQSGWLRASHRALRSDATDLRPVKTHKEEDAEPLVPGQWTEARVEIMPFGHIFRAGSRIRLSVDTPGDTRAEWYWILLDQDDTVQHTVGHSEMYPSSVLLPIIPSVSVPTPLPDCGAMRAQPCRSYTAYENTPMQ